MRPIHGLWLIVVLVLVLVGGLFLVVKEPVPSGVAGALPEAEAPVEDAEPASPAATLQADGERAAERSALEAAPAPPAAAPSASTASRARFRLRGRVVDESGAPVVGAQVFAAPGGGMREVPLDVLDPKAMPWVRRSDAKTDAEGRFEVALDTQSVLRLAVRAPSFAPHDAEHTISGEEHDLGDVVLSPGVVLEGRVVDSAGRGVAGAELRRLAEGTGMVMLAGMRGALLATADEEGRFRADQLAPGPWRVLVTSEAHPDKVESGEAERAGEVQASLVFTLEDGSEVHGRVVGAPPELLSKLSIRASPRRGEGPDGAVAVRFDGGGPSPASLFGGARRAPCRADGTFVLRGLRANTTYRLVAREGEGERAFQAKTWTAPATARAGDRGVQLLFKPETALVFQVVDDVTGEPITELDVQAGFRWPMPLFDESTRPVRSFPEGRVRFAPFPNRPDGGDGALAELRLEAAGYQGLVRRDISLADGQDTDIGVVRLARAPRIEVTVLDDATGEPVAGARVVLEEERADDGGRRMSFTMGGDDDEPMIGGPGAAQRARTGSDGIARVTSLPGKRGSLRVTSRDHAAWSGETRNLPLSEDSQETVRLRRGSTVLVEVVDLEGRPVPRVAVEHELDGEEPEEVFRLGGGGANQTDAQGRVVFAHLQAGLHRFRLTSAASSAGPMRMMRGRRAGGRNLPASGGGAPWTELVVADGTSETLRLVAPARGGLEGTVLEGGEPLANATVRLTRKDNEMPELAMLAPGGLQARTDAKGRYEIDDVEEGLYRATVTHSSRAMAHEAVLEVREGKNELDLDLPVAIVEGRVLDADQKPVEGARVRAERVLAGDGGGPRFAMTSVMVMADGGDSPEVTIGGPSAGEAVRTDAEGRFSLRGVASDVDLVVKVSSREHQPQDSETLRVRPDETLSKVDFELEAGGTIEVSVVRGDGQPGATCLVRARAESGDEDPKTAVTNSAGAVRLSGLKPGRWLLTAEALGGGRGGAESDEETVEVSVAKPQKVTLQVP